MIQDRQGNPVSGATPDAIRDFDQGVSEFNLYRGDPPATADRAIAGAPGFVMAYVLKAYLCAFATEPRAAAEAARLVERARGLGADDREASHLAVLGRLLGGDWVEAAVAMDFHNARYPRDLVGLQAGHLMDFYRANARDMRDRLARALPRWSASVPGYGVVLGMYAFGLEETGDYARAEALGRQAVALEPLDCWAHHAVAHVMVIDWTLAEAAARGGLTDLAEALAHERLALKPHSPVAMRFLDQARSQPGRSS